MGVIDESFVERTEEGYAGVFEYDVDAPLALRRLWVDAHGGLWLESLDGNRVVVPSEIRPLVAKRARELRWRG